MQEILYRQLNPADYNEYKRARLDCLKQYPDNFGNTVEEELSAASLKLTAAIQSPDNYNFVWGAFNLDQKLIALCGFITEKSLKTRHRGEIIQLFVDQAYSGLGIGKKILQAVIRKAFDNDQTEQVTLSVVSTNDKAISLYKQLGFTEYGMLENYFKSGTTYFTQSFFCLKKKNPV